MLNVFTIMKNQFGISGRGFRLVLAGLCCGLGLVAPVQGASLVSIGIAPAGAVFPAGQTLSFTATGNYSDGSSQDLTSSVTWSTADSAVATVAASGIATGTGPGTTSLTAAKGTISSAVSVGITGTKTYANSAAIPIPSVGAASPYPSTLSVGGAAGAVTKVTVGLLGLTHTWPHDVGVLVVGPTGAKTLVMADAGGGNKVSGINLTFDNAAAASLPTGQITAGTYKPTSYNANDPFPAGAPASPYVADLSIFNNLAPNGTWSLYVADDAAGDSGSIANGWTLTLTTVPNTPPTITSIAAQTTTVSTPTPAIPFTVGSVSTSASSLTVSGSSSNPTLLPNAGITFGGSGASRTVTLSPAVGVTGITTVTLVVTDPNGLSSNTSFTLTVNPPAGTSIFANTTSIAIPDHGAGIPYPSTIAVSGMSGNVTKVTVQLYNLNHTWPHDVGVLLVGPTGQKVLLMSDAGGGNRLNNVNLNFDDTASASLPSATAIVSGSYMPTGYDLNDPFPAPAPAGPYSTTLANFSGLTPNGTWSLYVVDDSAQDLGSIAGGWALTLSSGLDQPPTISGIPDQSTPVNTATSAIPFTIGDQETAAASLTLSAASSNPTLVPTANVYFGGSASNRTVVVVPAADQTGTATITVTVSDAVGSASTSFLVTVTTANNPTTITTAYWSNQADDNHNGCYESATLNWLPAVNGSGSYSVYEIAYFRINLTSWVPFFTNGVHSITGSSTANAQAVDIPVDPNKGNCTAYDYKIELYRVGVSSPDYTRSADYDSILKGHMEEGVPDIIAWGPAIAPYFTTTFFASGDCAIQHGCTGQGTRRLLRFNTQARNIGKTDLYMGAPGNNPLFIWDPCHGHWHFNDYASYRLLNGNAQIAAGNKLGFCVEDVGPWDPNAPAFAKYNCNNQGIQAGWYDLYNGDTTCNWIDVTGIPPGSYTLEIHLNPYGYIKEANTNNNITTVTVTITNTPPVVSAIPDQSTPQNVATSPIAFSVWDAETPWDALLITANSSNPTLIPNANIALSGSGTNRTVTLTPAANQTGVATITLSVDDGYGSVVTSSFKFTVFAASLTSITVTPTTLSLPVGQSTQYTATGYLSDGSTKDLTSSAVWQSGTPAVATINSVGLATIVGVGTSQITASQAGLSGSASLTGTAGNGATVFYNTSFINISPIGVASPYPSTIPVSGLSGAISKVTVTLYQYSHTWPHDVGVLLMSPSGQMTLLMADAGAGNVVNNATLTFDDAATASLPNGQIVSGTYKPTSYFSTDPFQAPVPAGPYPATLSVFNGYQPNGTWSLYVIDDATGDAGSIAGGWSIGISVMSATPPTITSVGSQTAPMNTIVGPLNFTVGDALTAAGNLRMGASSSNPTLVPNGNLRLGGSGANRTLCVTPIAGQTGTATISVSVTNDASLSTTTTFGLTVTNATGIMTFVNASTITIPSQGAGTPYPSIINVSSMGGNVSKVTAMLNNLTHTWPHDIGALLVSPTGQSTLLMADVGAGNRVNGVTLNFDDAAGSSLGTGQIVSGTFKPSSANANDPFPAGPPAGPYTAALSTFGGIAPNGAWSLYVADDSAGDSGAIAGGWSLTLYTTNTGGGLLSRKGSGSDSSANDSRRAAAPAVLAERPVIESAAVLPDGQVRLSIHGSEGLGYVIQATTNQVDWVDLFQGAFPAESFDYIDAGGSKFPQRYYRVTVPPARDVAR